MCLLVVCRTITPGTDLHAVLSIVCFLSTPNLSQQVETNANLAVCPEPAPSAAAAAQVCCAHAYHVSATLTRPPDSTKLRNMWLSVINSTGT